MKKNTNLKIIVGLFALLIYGCTDNDEDKVSSLTPVPFNNVRIEDAFWSPRLEAHASRTLAVCIAQMQDSTERINNFKRAAGLMEGTHQGIYYDDSDVYKAMEGMAYSLINHPNPELEALLDQWIAYIAGAQLDDGYLNTYYTLTGLENRWTDMSYHEMYCGGHMIEAAVAHHMATGKNTFLDVATRFADHLDENFGPGKRHWVAGHQEIELALVKLYHVTKEPRYLDLAYWILEERGHGYGAGRNWDWSHWGPAYCQDDVPVSEISDIKGHAVRAMYMFSGMADVAAEENLPDYIAALERVWEDVVYRNMYVTGGIGASGTNEGFDVDYYLPNKEAYCETCASIGMVFWNSRMNLLSGNAKYVDVLERSLYNGVLSGVSLEGDLFFYVNPLESDGDHHRQRWFGCACCPSNVSRFIPSVGKYIYATGSDKLYVNLFVGGKAEMQVGKNKVQLVQETSYPWEGNVSLELSPASSGSFDVKIRIPEWCKAFSCDVNGKSISGELADGYLTLSKKWKKNDHIQLNLDMPVELVASDPKVEENTGKRAIQRGPLVYCMEQNDQPDVNISRVVIKSNTDFSTTDGIGKLEGMKLIQATIDGRALTFIPYNAWDNRSEGKMKVWIDYEE